MFGGAGFRLPSLEDVAMFFVRLLADIIVVIHFAYIAFVVVGQLGIMVGYLAGWQWIRNPWFRLVHLAMIAIVVVEAMVQFECPLTTWERDLRIYAGQIPADHFKVDDWQVEEESFVAGLVRSMIMYDREVGPILVASYYIFGALVLIMVFVAPPRFRRYCTPSGEPPSAQPAARAT
jgi:hypothetical protein